MEKNAEYSNAAVRSHIEPNRIVSFCVGWRRKIDQITEVRWWLQSFRFDYSKENYRQDVRRFTSNSEQPFVFPCRLDSAQLFVLSWGDVEHACSWTHRMPHVTTRHIQVLNHLLTRKHLKCKHRFGNLWHQFTLKWFFCCCIYSSLTWAECLQTMQFCTNKFLISTKRRSHPFNW